MKTSLLGAALLAFSSFAAVADTPLSVAIFDFQTGDDTLRELAPKVSALLNVEFSTDARFIMVERGELEKALGEQELGLSSLVTEGTAAKVGQLTGATLLVTGRVMKVDRDTIVIAKLIGTETSRVFAEKIILTPSDSPVTAIPQLEKKLAALALDNRATLLGKADDPAARLAALKRSIEGKRRPAVIVTIPEQHFGRPVIDPAAETELSLIFQECGFALVDAKSAAKPEIEITGEAFSERGFQKGGLIGCKARVEIKVRRVSDGAILLADRQVGVGVDLAEHIAAKIALQNATRALADRIVPLAAQ